MLVADEYVGSLDDDDVAARVADADPLAVTVDDTERRRSRFRTTADDGTELGVVVGRELRDGDVLAAEEHLVVVSLDAIDAMVLDFGDLADPAGAAPTALALGHAVGNRHWDLAVEGDRAYLPMADSRDRMTATVEPHLPEGATVDYEAVPPTLFDDETDHSHGDHSHEGHSHGGHDHSHGGHSHEDHGSDTGVRTIDTGGDDS